ncbi:MAG: hypothetical protein H0U90_00195 [Actinobacteria bacterium]|nr:hypothetical protein [Actinomycetota bacterium]
MDGLLDLYLLGVALGLGVAAGTPGQGREGNRALALALIAAAAVAAALIAVFATGWAIVATIVGVAIGVFSFRHLAPAAVLAAALALALLALVPVVGYLEALAAPLLGERLRRRASGRFAGLRILAKD